MEIDDDDNDDDDDDDGFIWQSCPAINVYTADNLDKTLDSVTRNFCKQEVPTFIDLDEVWMSKYRGDFSRKSVDVTE